MQSKVQVHGLPMPKEMKQLFAAWGEAIGVMPCNGYIQVTFKCGAVLDFIPSNHS